MGGRNRDGRGHTQATLWSRFRRTRLAVASAWLLGILLLTSIITLPYALKWHNVQSLSLAVRHPPSITPVVPLSRYTSLAMIRGAASEVGPRDGGIVAKLAPIAHRLVSAMGHDDLGRSLFYRVWPALLISRFRPRSLSSPNSRLMFAKLPRPTMAQAETVSSGSVLLPAPLRWATI